MSIRVTKLPEPADVALNFVQDHWDNDLTLRQWWRQMADDGLAFPTWPVGLGGLGWGSAAAAAVVSTFHRQQVIGPPTGVGVSLGGPTLLVFGTEEQQHRFLPSLASGEESWCQLFSEPDAGSDLPSLRTRAVSDGGDGWIVNGQKVWNSGAALSDRGLLLARTDPEVPKRQGISYFVVDMVQDGVKTRPLRQMNGDADFDEVFITDGHVASNAMIGRRGDGWKVAQTTLAFERAGIGGRASARLSLSGGARREMLDLSVGELVDRLLGSHSADERITGYMLRSKTMIELAREYGLTSDPLVRQKLAAYRISTEVNRLTAMRARGKSAAGGRPGPESSVGKLAVSLIARQSRALTLNLIGAYGMLSGTDAPYGGDLQHVTLSGFAAGLGGGTDEIQRNTVGERTLGLPRELDVGV